MADIDVGKFGKKSGIDLSTFTGGLKKDQMKTDAQKSIFDKLDTDKNGVLDENEISALRSAVDSNGDNTVSKREAKRFLKDKDLKNIDKKDLLAFLQNYNINTENVESTQVISKNGQDIVQITYKDGSIEQINPDKSSQITQTDQNGYTKTSFLDENKKLLKDFVTTKEGNTIEIEYAQDGKTPVHSVAVNKENGSVVTTDYENGKPSTKQVKTGTTTSNYTFDEQGNAVITSKIENEGIPAKERRTRYVYNDDGTVTENITENGKTTERLRKGETIISEKINDNGKISTRTYYEKGYEESTTDSNGNPVVNVYSLENKKLAQQKTVDGKQYSVLYDGEGNTRTIVQNGESLQSIADKFGCSVEDLKELNADVLNGKKYFPVGAEIKIPGELEADAPSLQNRKSAEEAKAEYTRDEQIRAQKRAERAALDAQYKSMGLINYKGQGGKITGTWKGGSKEEFTIIGEADKGRHLAKGKDGKIVTISHDGVILKDEYVQLTNLYSSGDKIQGKITVINEDGSRTLQTRNYVEIKGADLPHGRKAVVDGKGKVYVMSNDGIILDNNYVARSNYADSIRGDKTTAQAATVDMLSQQLDSAQAAFDAQMKEDGWAADVADGISNIWGIFQENGNQAWRVREDLAQYRKDMDALKTAAKQGDSQFRAKFKQMFGVDYNQNAIADYMMNPTSANYKKAFGTKNNIGERVAKYNESQQTGAAVVKGATTVAAGIAIGVATGGTGLVALGAAAAATTASSVAINASDRLSSEVGLREGEMGQIFENALWDGASVLAGGVVGKVAQTTIKGVSTAATVTRSAANAAGDVAMGAAQEYAQTGEVTLGGTALNAALGTVGMAAESGVFQRAGQKIKGALHKGESTSAQASFQNPATAQLSGAELKDGSMMVKPQGTKSVETPKSEFKSETPAQSAEMSKSPSNNNVPENNASANSASQVESKPKYTEEFEPHYEKQKINGEIIDKRLTSDNPELDELNHRYASGNSLLQAQAEVEDAIAGLNISNNTPEYIESIRTKIKVVSNGNPEMEQVYTKLLNEAVESNTVTKVSNSAASDNVTSVSTQAQGQSSAAIDVPEVNPVPSPNVKQSITGSVDGSDNLLKTANLDDDKIQAELLAMLEKEIPSSRRVPGRVKTLKELQTLVNNPSYAQLDEAGKRMAKIAILKSNQRLDSRALYDDLNVSIEVKRKINTFEKSMTSPETAAALYNDNDFAALILVAKSKGVDEATIAKMQEAYNKAKNNGSLLVHKTDINVSNIPVRQVVVDGKSFNVKVVDCTDDAVFAHPELYGLPAGTTADNIRLTVHMNDGFNKAPQMTIGKMRQSEDLNLSASVTDGKNTLYDNQQVGIVLDYDMGAVSYASNYAAGTGFCKTNTDFAKAKLDLNNPSKGTFIKDQFVGHMKAQGYDISAEDYAAFSSKLSGKNDIQTELRKLAVNGQIDFNGKQIPVEQVEKVLFESTDDLMHVSYEMRGIKVENGFNEVNVYNPEIKAIYVRGNSADDTIESILSADLLNYAQRRNLPIIFQRCVIKS